ncbi:hypothetical protein Ancab_012945, partial [Ancistrocladus abbreviatus]
VPPMMPGETNHHLKPKPEEHQLFAAHFQAQAFHKFFLLQIEAKHHSAYLPPELVLLPVQKRTHFPHL